MPGLAFGRALPPHPGPLPWGEGEAWSGVGAFDATQVFGRVLRRSLRLRKAEGVTITIHYSRPRLRWILSPATTPINPSINDEGSGTGPMLKNAACPTPSTGSPLSQVPE